MARNNIDKILSKASEDPKVARLIEIGVTVTNLEKEKTHLKANKEGLDKKSRNEKLAVINTELGKLRIEKEALKKGNPAEVKPETPEPTQTPTEKAVVVDSEPAVTTADSNPATPEPSTPQPEVVPASNENVAELNKSKEELLQQDIEAIKLGKEIGKSKDELVAEGIDRALVDKHYDVNEEPKKDQEKINAIMQQIMLYMENEKKENEEYEKERKQDLEKIVEKEAKLNELIALREKLAKEEGENQEPPKEEGGAETTNNNEETEQEEPTESEEERKRKEKEERFKIDETESENIQKMQKMILEYHENKKIIKEKREELDKELSKKNGWKIWKDILPDIKVKKLKEEIKKLESNQEELEEAFEVEERKEFPVAYYAVEKIKDPAVKRFFIAKGKNGEYISMKLINGIDKDSMYDNTIYNPIHQFVHTNTEMARVGPSGFVIKIVNKNEIADKYGYYSTNNPLGRYDVIDPNGKVILENANFDDALEKQFTEKHNYSKKVEEEWNNLNKK